MALSFTVNQSPSNGTVSTWNWISTLITAGWTKIQDSDGTTYSSTGTQVTGSGTGANGLDNPFAWVRLRIPSGTKEFIFQHRGDTETRFWRIMMSYTGFSGGLSTATQTPDATDTVYFSGSGTGAAPGFNWYWNDNGTYRQHIIASNTAPYPFYMITYINGGTDCQTICFMDDVSGTVSTGDTDPVVYYNISRIGNGLSYGQLFADNGGLFGNLNNSGTPVLTSLASPTYNIAGQLAVPNNIGSNSFTTKDEEFPLMYMRRAVLPGPNGYKGISNNLCWKGTNRAIGDTYNNQTRLIVQDITFPWDGTTTPLV